MAKERSIIKANNCSTEIMCNWTPIKGAMMSRISACREAIVAAPSALPMEMEVRETGATSISFKKPNSLSQTVETVEKNAMPITFIAIMPGYINFIKSTPKLPGVKVRLKPAPKINRNIIGWKNEETILVLSRQYLIISRRQIVMMGWIRFILLQNII